MLAKLLKSALLAIFSGALLTQAPTCQNVQGVPFSELTKTGGVLVGALYVPKIPQ
ncbi:MAG TPA: hypothetical protein VMZ31_04270 [Phycisphaerae bacterium]|nr:hypothetical protein [Phycisphaerae bacterium]